MKIELNEYSKEMDDSEFEIQMHIDYDKDKKILYNNIYFIGYKNVLKMPIFEKNKECNFTDWIIEKFKLSNYVFILHY